MSSGLLSIRISLPVLAAEKPPPYYDAAATMLHCRDAISQVMSRAWRSQDTGFGILPKRVWFLIHQTWEYFLMLSQSLKCHLTDSNWAVMCLLLKLTVIKVAEVAVLHGATYQNLSRWNKKERGIQHHCWTDRTKLTPLMCAWTHNHCEHKKWEREQREEK